MAVAEAQLGSCSEKGGDTPLAGGDGRGSLETPESRRKNTGGPSRKGGAWRRVGTPEEVRVVD